MFCISYYVFVAPPGNVTNIKAFDLTTTTVLISWDPPASIDDIDILYSIEYCTLNNGTVEDDCKGKPDQKDNSYQLTDLMPATSYQVTVAALNQQLEGKKRKFVFTTLG
jgi:Fibronectin type III domain.